MERIDLMKLIQLDGLVVDEGSSDIPWGVNDGWFFKRRLMVEQKLLPQSERGLQPASAKMWPAIVEAA